MGKSTTGNKLLGTYDADQIRKGYTYQYVTNPSTNRDSEDKTMDKIFLESEQFNLKSTTKSCQIVINKTLGVTVLDVQGFADSEECNERGVYRANLQIVRNMIYAQAGQDIKFHRVIYFLPCRRIPELADGNLQEELKVMHYFYGEEIFNRMVIIITNGYMDPGEIQLTEKILNHIKKVFLEAYKLATGSPLSLCPPIEYISRDDEGQTVRKKMSSADVITKTELKFKILDDTCLNCSAKIQKMEIGSRANNAVDEVPREILMVIDPSNGKKIKYEESRCHPLFIPKYSIIKRILGGIIIIVTLGAVKLALNVPGFFNSEEICIKCKYAPGQLGCHNADTNFLHNSAKIHVKHKSEIDIRIFEN